MNATDRVRNGPLIGHLNEERFMLRAQELGHGVFVPRAGFSRADCILQIDYKNVSVQIKTATLRDGLICFQSCSKGYSNGSRSGLTLLYTPEEIDYIGLYCEDLQKAFLVPVDLCQKQKSRLVYENTGIACIGCPSAQDFEF